MCTLSWQQSGEELSIVFSRDERRDRAAADEPSFWREQGVTVLAPRDPESDGFWLATNEHGMTFCLLNDYLHAARMTWQPTYSRGQLVRRLSHCRSPLATRDLLAAITAGDYAPCHLFVFWHTEHPIAWHWNGQHWCEHIAPSSPFSTSSLLPQVIPRVRRWFYSRFVQQQHGWRTISPAQQLAAHRQTLPGFSWASIAMARPTRATVSMTQLLISPKVAVMNYWPGDPARHGTSAPTSSQRLTKRVEPLPCSAPLSSSSRSTLDLPNMLRAKNPALFARLQGWRMTLLAAWTRTAFIHQRLQSLSDTSPRRFPVQVLNRQSVSAEQIGVAELPPADTRPVFVANHPTGGHDGLLLLAWLLAHYPRVEVVVTDLLTHLKPLEPLCCPVDRYQSSRQSVRQLHKAFASDAAILVFPAGCTARREQGRLHEFPWHSMPVTLALKYQRPIVPLHLEGANSWRFYALAALRKRLGVALNLEMTLLPREFLRPATPRFGLRTGPVLMPDAVHRSGQTDAERMATIRACYNALADNIVNPPSFPAKRFEETYS